MNGFQSAEGSPKPGPQGPDSLLSKSFITLRDIVPDLDPMLHRQIQRTLTLFILLTLVAIPSTMAEKPFPKPQGLVNDFANVIPLEYEQKLVALTNELLQKTGTPVVVVTMADIGGAEYNNYVNRLYTAWGIGKKGEDKGVLVFVTIKERKMRIEIGYGLEGILPDGLVGEIRDQETAEIAIQAALTGHLVFSTLHTNDASGALTRLIDMGVKPFLVSSAVQAVMAQRLIRRLCSKCKEIYDPTDVELASIGLSKDEIRGSRIYRPVGCEDCKQKHDFDELR